MSIVTALTCAGCSAPVRYGVNRCDYCAIALVFQPVVQDPLSYRPTPYIAISGGVMCSTEAFDAKPGGIVWMGQDGRLK